MSSNLAVGPDAVRPVVERWNPDGTSGAVDDCRQDHAQVLVLGLPRCGREEVEQLLRWTDGYTIVERGTDAAIVLMVIDAASVIGQEELELLDAFGVGGVPFAVVLTKVDVCRDWESVRARDQKVLADHSDIYGDARIVALSERIGPTPLFDVVDRVRRQMVVQSGGGVIAETRAMIDHEIRTLRESDPGADLRAERAELLADRDGRRSERLAQMRTRLQRARAELAQLIADTTRTTVASARIWIEESTRTELRSLPARLEHVVENNTVVFDAAISTAVGLGESGGPVQVPRFPDGPTARPRGNEERITVLVGASAGFGLGRIAVTLLEMVPVLDIASIPVTLVLGAGAAWWLSRARGVAADRAHARAWLVETMSTVRAQWEQRVLNGLLDAEVDLGSAIMAESRDLVASAQARIAEIDAELRALGQTRSGQLAACERDLAILNGSGT